MTPDAEPAEIEDLDVWLAQQQAEALAAGQTLDSGPRDVEGITAEQREVWDAMRGHERQGFWI